MRRRTISTAMVMLLCALACAGGIASAEDAVLNADLLRYDPSSRLIRAEGNVRLARPGVELFSRMGEGTVGGDAFKLSGEVRGEMRREGLKIRCDVLTLVDAEKGRQILEASGKVLLTRGEDRVTAARVRWTSGVPRYSALGDVDARFEAMSIRADEAGRDGERFWGKGVRRYEDRKNRYVLSAAGVEGRILGGAVDEMTAQGDVDLTLQGSRDESVRVTGDKGVFSRDRGTVVISGSAKAVQEGRTVSAGSLVLHLDSNRIEALGRPQVIFTLPGRAGMPAPTPTGTRP
jgi:lipopolysaccharide assembly outer membrane protein LptD (OstA)